MPRLQLSIEPNRVEHLEGCRVVGPGARHLFKEIVGGERLDEDDPNILLGEPQREAQANRARPDNDHPVRDRLRHRLYDLATTSFTAPAQPL
jgi:hypothetical protein